MQSNGWLLRAKTCSWSLSIWKGSVTRESCRRVIVLYMRWYTGIGCSLCISAQIDSWLHWRTMLWMKMNPMKVQSSLVLVQLLLSFCHLLRSWCDSFAAVVVCVAQFLSRHTQEASLTVCHCCCESSWGKEVSMEESQYLSIPCSTKVWCGCSSCSCVSSAAGTRLYAFPVFRAWSWACQAGKINGYWSIQNCGFSLLSLW